MPFIHIDKYYFNSIALYLICSLSIHGQVDFHLANLSDSLFENANSIVLFSNEVITIESSTDYKYAKEEIVLILNKKAENKLDLMIPYVDGVDKIDIKELSYYDTLGQIITSVQKRDIDDRSIEDGFSLITDGRYKYYDHHHDTYPVVRVLRYTKSSKNTLHPPAWYPFDYYSAIKESRMAIEADIPILIKQSNFEPPFHVSEIAETQFLIKNHKALRSEPYAPSNINNLPHIYLRPESYQYYGHQGKATSCRDFGDWFYSTFLQYDSEQFPPAELRDKLAVYISADSPPIDKAKALYEFVQRNNRYVNISLNDGGLHPLPPDYVYANSYGDCKALSFYYQALLSMYDIEADFVAVTADADESIDMWDDFASTIPGNHAITRVLIEGDTLWADCTSKYLPFNYLGEFSSNRKALVLAPHNSRLVNTPLYDFKDNHIHNSIQVADINNNQVVLKIDTRYRGLTITGPWSLAALESATQMERYQEKMSTKAMNATVHSLSIIPDEKLLQVNEVSAISASQMMEKAGDYHLLHLPLLHYTIPHLPKDDQRLFDISFDKPMLVTQDWIIDGDEFELYGFEEKHIETPFGHYHLVQQSKDGMIILKQSLALYDNYFEAEDYESLKHFLDQCIVAETNTLALIKK